MCRARRIFRAQVRVRIQIRECCPLLGTEKGATAVEQTNKVKAEAVA